MIMCFRSQRNRDEGECVRGSGDVIGNRKGLKRNNSLHASLLDC